MFEVFAADDSPFGLLGRAVNPLFLTSYLRCFLIQRNSVLKQIAESDEWHRYLENPGVP
jgi:hypothetical protein